MAPLPRPEPASIPSGTLMLQALQGPEDPGLNELVPIYTEAFLPEERKPLRQLQHMLAEPAYRFFLARRHTATVGFAIVAQLAGEQATLLEYMAIALELRGQGLGRTLFREVTNAILTEDRNTMLIEVESDRHQGPEQPFQTRRKLFYRSLGARELAGLRWIMPPVAAAPPPPMDMLAFGDLPDSLPRATLHRWLTAIYVTVYGQTPQDARLAAKTASLPRQIVLL